MKNQLFLLLGFFLSFILFVPYLNAQCESEPEQVLYNFYTKTKVAVIDTCGNITAIVGNEDLVEGKGILVPYESKLFISLTDTEKENIKNPSVILMK